MLRDLAESDERVEMIELRFVTYTEDPEYMNKHEYFYEYTDEWGYVFTEYKHHRTADRDNWQVITHNWWDAGDIPPREPPSSVKQELNRKLSRISTMQ